MIECISPVKNSQGTWSVGSIVEDEALSEWLLRDSPDSWRHVKLKKAATYEPVDSPAEEPAAS